VVVRTGEATANGVIYGIGFHISTSYVFPFLYHLFSDLIIYAATSVEAERQFSTGRRSMNFMQHNMSHDTFRARMALGSWDGTPIFPEFETAADVIDSYMAH
jgi:hypothetical protein